MTTDHAPRPRYLENTNVLQTVDTHKEILFGLNKLVSQFPPEIATFVSEDESVGLFGGPCSVAYLFFKLARSDSIYANVQICGYDCAHWTKQYLELSPKVIEARKAHGKSVDFPSFAQTVNRQCGIWNENLSYAVLKAVTTDQAEEQQTWVQEVLKILPGVLERGGDIELDESQGGFNEYIAGRTGYLFFLRFLRVYLPSPIIPPNAIKDTIEVIMSEGPAGENHRNWRWVGRPQLYLGAGHGWTGIITQILLSDPSYATSLRPVLLNLLSWQLEDGNWPTFVPGTCPPEKEPLNSLVQWGHGGTGTVMSLLSIRHVYETDSEVVTRLDNAVAKAQDMIWQKGLLTKEPCMAHGASGSAMCFADPTKTAHFLAATTEDVVEAGVKDGSLEPSSLSTGIHRGLASRIWAFYCYERGVVGRYATYNDI